MARLESQAVAGYFPTPTHLLSAVADLCEAAEGAHTDAVADPCAGKGEALLALLGAWYPEREPGTLSSGSRATAHVFAAELEGSRYKDLETALYNFRGGKGRVQSHRGDAFRLDLGLTDHRPPAGLTCLYLNPPYDHDARFKRLEERFLQRFMPALMTGGVLLFVVPVHALSASFDTLGTWARDVEVLRFPDPDYAVFKQVVVRARRRPGQLPVADPAVVDALRAAMSDHLGLPTIDAAHKPYTFPVAPMTLDWRNRPQPGEAGLGWKAALLDEGALFATHKAWHQTARNGTLVTAARVFPKTALGSLRARYPMAVPPKPGHVAAAIAAGVFNGETLCADDSTTEAPPIIVKGRFARVWRTTEEKRNMEGETTGHVQVEEPRLEVTALDLRELVFCDLKSSPLPSGSQEPSSMTTGDLLTQYGNGLLTTLRAHCPVLHDPSDPSHVIPLVQTARPLYAAQAHAAMACVKLLGGPGVPRARRKGTFAFLIGEVGSGKSCTFLVVARTIGARRTLMVCPPHLLSSWDDEVKAAWPEARVVTLASVNDIDALAAEKADGGDHRPVVAVLSREGAKLGHGWATVSRCGECGAPAHAGDHAERRSTCLARIPTPTTPDELYASRLMAVMVGHTPALQGKPRCTPMHALRYALDLAVAAGRWATALLIGECFADAGARLNVVKRVPVNTEDDLRLLLSVPPETPGWLSEVIRRIGEHDEAGRKGVAVFRAWAAYIHHDKRRPEDWNQYGRVYSQDGVLRVEGRTVGTPDALGVVLAALPVVPFRVCGAPLYQAIPSPRRTALATYIARRHPELFDIVGLDEAHELSGEGSAQERAAHRITGTRAPTVLLTGSILNGYAAHLFPHLWALDPKFREAFKRDDRGKFAKQYGYRRRFVAEPTGGKASKRGKVTDRVEGAVRDMGESPGVQPTAILHWLLPHAVTLHKGDLEVHIPPLTITRVAIHPTEEMASRHKAALVDLMRQIKEDRFTDMAGALWGQLTLAPSHLDRITVDVCGSPDGAWTVAYPEHRGGAVVHRGECFPADTVLPKERWMLDELQRQIARGRATIVLSHHVELMPRYARLIREHLKLKVSVLDANKVSPAKRKAWIQAQNAAGAQVLLTNPVAIGTGLNVLVFYATELWMENPGCNAITFRQAVGRIDRIGQTKPTEVYFPVYEDTIQGPAHTLLLQKVAVSQSTDGLDARSALQAAGVGDAPDVSALSIGKLLFDLLDKSADLRRAIAAATPRTR